MGRRLRVLWRLRCGLEDPSVLPAVIVAPVRALAQRLGPHVEDVVPITVKPGQVVDRDELAARLVAAGYRREYQVEARGEFAVRGSILDVYPSTADHPVRIDLWGDEVDRLQTFSVADQRATGDLGRGRRDLPLPGAAAHRGGAGPGREADRRRAVGPGPVGAALRGAALRRHGVVAAVADRRRAAPARPAARRRPGAPRRAAPDAGPGRGAERRGGVAGQLAGLHLGRCPKAQRDCPACRCRSTGCCATPAPTPGPSWRRPTGPTRPTSPARPSRASTATRRPSPAGSGGLLDGGYRVVFAADGAGSAERIRRSLADEGVIAPITETRRHQARRLGWWWRRIQKGFVLPGPQAGGGGRGRPHRPAAGPPQAPGRPAGRGLLRRPEGRRLRRPQPARRRPLRRHGRPHHGRRRARLPAGGVQGAATSSTSRPTRSAPSAATPAASRPPCPGWAAPSGPRPGPRSRRPSRRSPRSSSSSTAGGWPPPGTPSRPTRPGRRRWRRRSPTRRRPTRPRPSRT